MSQMEIHRMGSGDEELWSRAVAGILSPQDREGRLAPIDELTHTLCDARCYLYVALQGDEPIGLLSAYEFPDAVGGGHLVYLYDNRGRLETSQTRRC